MVYNNCPLNIQIWC